MRPMASMKTPTGREVARVRRKTGAFPESPMVVRIVTKEPYDPRRMALAMTMRADGFAFSF